MIRRYVQVPCSRNLTRSANLLRGIASPRTLVSGERILNDSKAHERSHLSIPAASQHHHDLDSFLDYAQRTELKDSTTIYKGTHYEYTVVTALKRHHFNLHRTGRANDLGIDVVGHWRIPDALQQRRDLRVLLQCKAVPPKPSMIRELEGAYVGAPSGWRGDGVLALLVANREATKGVREALQRSRCPMGVMQVTTAGLVKQFLWNPVAASIGLEGMGVTMRYDVLAADHGTNDGGLANSIALTWLGEIWEDDLVD